MTEIGDIELTLIQLRLPSKQEKSLISFVGPPPSWLCSLAWNFYFIFGEKPSEPGTVMEGKWIKRIKAGAPAIVFVHGVLAKGETCWLHASGAYWPDIVANDEDLSASGVYVFNYRTGFFSGTYRLGDAVDALKEHLHLDGVLEAPAVIFVCHSMGGILVRKYLVQRAAELIERKLDVGLFLIASPSLGSEYANWLTPIARIFDHSQADALRFTQSNAWLLDLDREFMNLKEEGRLRLLGKELVEDQFIWLRSVWRKQVVEPFSGARYFGDPYKVPASDHFSIAKIENATAIQHRLLRRLIMDLVQKERGKSVGQGAGYEIGSRDSTLDLQPVNGGSHGTGDELISKKEKDNYFKKNITELLKDNRLLSIAFEDVKGKGVVNHSVFESILNSDIEKSNLEFFYKFIYEEIDYLDQISISNQALELSIKYQICHFIVDDILARSDLDDEKKVYIFIGLSRPIDDVGTLMWAHSLFNKHTDLSDPYYHNFLYKNAQKIVELDESLLTAHLLYPKRGPGRMRIDAFEAALEHVASPSGLVMRWIEWINEGYFDHEDIEGYESPIILYKKIQRGWENNFTLYKPIAIRAHEHLEGLLRYEKTLRIGLTHLISIVDARYKLADILINNVLEKVDVHYGTRDAHVFLLAKRAIYQLDRMNRGIDKGEENFEQACRMLHLEGDILSN